MKVLIFLLNLVLGAIFLFSAFTKLFPVEFFEIKIQEMIPMGQFTAAISARLIIGMEAILAFCFIFQLTFSKRLYSFTMGLILFFIAVNIYTLITVGNDSNCGCFGLAFDFTPRQSIVKNLLIFIVIYFLYKTKKTSELKFPKIVNLVIFLILISLPFILNPIILNPLNSTGDLKGVRLELEMLDKHPKVKGKTFTEDIKKGKKLIAFVSLTCNYCKIAAAKLTTIKKEYPQLPLYFIMNGDSVDMPAFYRATHAGKIPSVHFNGGDDFLMLGGTNLPAIYWVEESVIYRRDNYLSFNLDEFRQWFEKDKK